MATTLVRETQSGMLLLSSHYNKNATPFGSGIFRIEFYQITSYKTPPNPYEAGCW